MSGDWSDPGRVSEYLGRRIPHRELVEQMLLEALPAEVERFADLGTGDGRLIALVRDRHPGARAVGVDSSEPMLARARRRFEGEQLIELREHDLVQPLPPAGLQDLDAIVSALAIHHLEDPRKRELFREVRERLRPGGVFVNLDLVRSVSDEQHARFRRAIGRPQDDPSDRLAGLTEQLEWLREARFEEVDCQFKWLEMTLVVARRGGGATS